MLTNTYNQQKLSAKFYKNGYWSLTGQFTAIRGFFLVILVKKVSPLMICDGIGVPGADADDDDNEYDGDESMQW